jgi:phosphoribosyl-AMP cyclohydrolase / phosphoribosyl-ATP pyrophosphohydrolase
MTRSPDGSPTDRALEAPRDLDALRFDERGLVCVVAQDARAGAVLMVAWANREALERSLEEGEMHFWSRSRRILWRKGETSGNVLRVRSLHADCDGDTVLALVEPAGPACHTGEATCFGAAAPAPDPLDVLWGVLEARARELPPASYTTRLLGDENLRIKKLGEETAELVSALARGETDRVRSEAADLLYHLLVTLLAAGVSLDELRAELAARGR